MFDADNKLIISANAPQTRVAAMSAAAKNRIVQQRNVNPAAVLVAVAAEQGLAITALLRGTALTAEDLENPSTVLSFEQEFGLIRNLLAHCGDVPGLGFEAGRRYRFTTLAPVGFAFVSSPNLRSAFEIIVRYADLNTSMVDVEIDRGQADLHARFNDDFLPLDVRRFAVERSIAVALQVGKEMLGRTLRPKALSFQFPAPSDATIFIERVGVTPSFGAPANQLVFSQADADTSLIHANPLALQLAEAHCQQYLATWRRRSGLAETVRKLMLRRPYAMPSITEIAETQCLSVRSLHRRLRDEGTAYTALRDEVRELLAEQLLALPRLPIDEIAARLGYAEAASFIHAFKRWKGQTPAAYRLHRDIETRRDR